MPVLRTEILLVLSAVLLSGCLNPARTRLPALQTGSPQAERKALERHDPFPSNTAGPDTFVRPRGFTEQRTQSRQIREDEVWKQRRRDRQIQPGAPSSQREYPQSVR
ncbi:MAG: hypothetical protein IID45_09045 [Planctomycetes bacterium]|nr:hypothetical protein [Planctomycetota bacterium]